MRIPVSAAPLTGTLPAFAVTTRRAQYSPSASPCGGRARSRTVCLVRGGIVTRLGNASSQRWAAGISGVTLSGSKSWSCPVESVTG